jgi:CheY-like chemotaxis protein
MSRKLRGIVLDDDDDDRFFIKRLLESRGYEVLAYDAPTECPLFHAHECQCGQTEACCDILITDVDMPKVSGLEFLEQQTQKGCKIPNIAVASGAWSDSKLEYAQRLGFTPLEKTPTWDALTDWLDQRAPSIDPNKSLSNWFRQQDKDLSSSTEQNTGGGE